MSSDDESTSWEKGWAGHQQQQLERLARLPLGEKLRWLEETHHLVQHLKGEQSPGKSER